MQLRPFQADIIAATRQHLRDGAKSVLIQSPTGSGKTVLTAFMLSTARARGKRAWFVVHRRELIKQSARTFREVGIPYGIVSAGFHAKPTEQVQICSIQTLARRMHLLPDPDLICWDEAHHVAAKSWAKVHGRYPSAVHIGLSATPERLDGRGLGQYFEHMVLGPPVRWLIEQGFLSPYRYYAPPSANLDSVRTRMGDFAREDAAAAMDKPSITGDAVQHYARLCPGRRAIAFCCSIQHSVHVAERFKAAGIRARHVDGETDPHERDRAMAAFERGDIQVITNVDLFGEGVDVPAMEAVILLRPTQSLALFLQQVGRSLRTNDGKSHATIIDHADNVRRHGMPDAEREWSLDQKQRAKKKGGSAFPVRTCPKCFHTMNAGTPICPSCQHVFIPESREPEQNDGDLHEITPEEQERLRKLRNREQAQARTISDLIRLGHTRGYRNPRAWAEHVMAARSKRATYA